MRKAPLIWILLLVSCCFSLVPGWYYQKSQNKFANATTENLHLQQEMITLERHMAFLKAHENELHFLETKGWITPTNRLLAQNILEKTGAHFDMVDYSFEPEQDLDLDETHSYKNTQIIWTCASLLDSEIFSFFEELQKQFPGILTLNEMTISRQAEINEVTLLAIRNQEKPHFIIAKLVLDWTTLKKDTP